MATHLSTDSTPCAGDQSVRCHFSDSRNNSVKRSRLKGSAIPQCNLDAQTPQASCSFFRLELPALKQALAAKNISLSTFLGTFRTETFRRAQGGKFVVSSDSGKPVLKQIGHRFNLQALASQSVRGSRQGRPARFLPLAHSPPSFQAARQLGHLQDADTKTGPDPGKGTWTCRAAQPSPQALAGPSYPRSRT